MKKKIHPKMNEAMVSCACGEKFSTLSVMKEIKVEVCSKCHPFFTGKQKFVDTAGRVERFRAKFGKVAPPKRRKKGKSDKDDQQGQKISAKG